MRDFAKWVIAATVSAGALPFIGIGPAGAADVPVPYGEPRYSQPQYNQPQYNEPQYNQPRYNPPRYSQPRYSQPVPPEDYLEENEVYRQAPPSYTYREAPPAYAYPPPPAYPPAYRYYEGPPAVAVLPPPVYGDPYYGFRRHYPLRRYETFRHNGQRITREAYGPPRGYRNW